MGSGSSHIKRAKKAENTRKGHKWGRRRTFAGISSFTLGRFYIRLAPGTPCFYTGKSTLWQNLLIYLDKDSATLLLLV